MEDEKKYLYSVRPRRVIRSLPELGAIRTAKSLYLSKEEVAKCLKDATVYRRFSADQSIQVTVSDVDRLHNDVFYSVDEWNKKRSDDMGKDRGTSAVISTTESKEETPVNEIQEPKSPTLTSDQDVSKKDSEVKDEEIVTGEVKLESDASAIDQVSSENTSEASVTTVVDDDNSESLEEDEDVDDEDDLDPDLSYHRIISARLATRKEKKLYEDRKAILYGF